MEYQVSARKYRPGTFRDVIGQPQVVQTLQNAILKKQVAHAYVFSGMRGVGKTTVARILAKALNCEQGPTIQPCETCPTCQEITCGHSLDVIEIDGASNTGVDDVRELRENVKFSPFRGTYRVYIIDEVHMLSNSAFNALLKTLEEPPSHVIFIFATTEVHKVPATVLSRCQHFTFRRIPRSEIIGQLRHVSNQAGATIEDRSLTAIAKACDGSMRDGLSLLDQAIALGGDRVKHEDLENLLGSVPEELARNLVEAILNQDAPGGIALVGKAFDQGYDVRSYCREIVERMRNLLVASVVPSRDQVQTLTELPSEEVDAIIAHSQLMGEHRAQNLFQIFSKAEDTLRASGHPRFVLEAAVVRATQFPETSTPKEENRGVASSPATQSQIPITPQKKEAPIKEASAPQRTPPPPSKPKPASKPISGGPAAEKKEGGPKKEDPVPAEKPQSFNLDLVMDFLTHEHPNISAFLEKGVLVKNEGTQVIIGYPQKRLGRSMEARKA